MKHPSRALLALLLATGLQDSLSARPEKPDEVEVTATVSSESAVPGAEVTVELELGLADGSHANSNRPADRNLVATTFFPERNEDVRWGKIRYPKATYVIEWYSVDPLPVFQNGAVIQAPVSISESAGPGELTLEGKLRVQVCDEEQCYPPERVPVKISLTVE